MDVSAIVARLTAECPTLEQVIAASTGGSQSPVATQASLYSLLSGLVGNRMYPLQLPEAPTHPSIVYQMVSSTPGVFEGYDVTHTDTFILNVRGSDYDALLTLVASIVAALAGENIEITDTLHDYDQRENLVLPSTLASSRDRAASGRSSRPARRRRSLAESWRTS